MSDPIQKVRHRLRGFDRLIMVVLATGVVVIGSGFIANPSSGAAGGTALVGTFEITPGSCATSTVTGSYFRMILSGGTQTGPFLSNSDSTCSNQTYTAMRPGTDGGIITGGYEPEPSPPFDSNGNSLAADIIVPQPFYGVNFSVSTNPVDPQTGTKVPAPSIIDTNGELTGNLSALGVSWNNQQFNQGSPKPDGTYPGNTEAVSGTYDAATGAYTLTWSSQVEGGPFNGFAGQWTVVGHFVAGKAGGASSSAVTGATGTRTSAGSPTVAAGVTTATTAPSNSTGTPTANSLSTTGSATPSKSAAQVKTTRRTVTLGVTTVRSGWTPSTPLVIVLAVIGLLALIALLLFELRLRALRQAKNS